ncbi:RNA polymerase, sigma subunit, ECF family [Verrucomicrobium sp. GAS474]|uniref:RNA polymerase sigma factor n=1 Tax=Verrucomicrobium sp. GAS474 TaxID=1882831 RepID=UPI0008794B25|nr:sigma-70 family RNA polymerase sigma factor [Verrucomicrobium sp. GAS474]SDU03557.1 RNA polymerase, sigma subunit, ECF family [Verrucomicrobium sp. GAS474]
MEKNDADLSHAPWVEAARVGDAPAQEALIRLYQQRIAGFVYAMTGETGHVEDLSQQIFVKMVHGLPSLKEAIRFEAWLFRLARNVCLSHIRRRRWLGRFVAFDDVGDDYDPPAPPPEATTEDREEAEARLLWLQRAMASLPMGQRELLAMLQDREMSYEEMARITGASVSSVKSRLFRAREQLKAWRQNGFRFGT